jgi:hypothetical protein
MTTDTGPTWGMSYRPTLAEAMQDLTRLVADGKCDVGTAADCAVAEVAYEGVLREVKPFEGIEGVNDIVALSECLYAANGCGRRAMSLAAELMAEIGEHLLEGAAPVGINPRREEGGEGSRFGGSGETVDEGRAGSQGEEEA